MAINLNQIKNLPLPWQIAIGAVPSVLLIALFIFLIFMPKQKEMTSLHAKLAKLDREIAVSEAKIKKLDDLIAENKMLQAKLKKLKGQLPEGKEVSVLLKQISELGRQSGLDILLWKPEAKKTDPQGLYVEIPVSVKVKAEYHKLGVFFSHISRLTRLVNITDLDLKIKKSKKGSGSAFIDANFKARTFASVDPNQQPKGKSKKSRKKKKKKR
jgi:type IV pilus assembly protein PilO